MHWVRDGYRELRAAVRRDGARLDVAEEIAAHLALSEEANVAAGMSPAAARADALRRFGSVTDIEEETCRIAERTAGARRQVEWLRDLGRDIRRACRSLRRAPAFSVTTTVTLAFALGAAAAVLAVLDVVVLRPFPYGDPEQLVWIDTRFLRQNPNVFHGFTPRTYTYYRDNARSLAAFGSVSGSGMEAYLTQGDGPIERTRMAYVTGNLAEVLRVRPMLGRFFLPSEDRPGGPAVVLLTHGYWMRVFGGDPKVVGSLIPLRYQKEPMQDPGDANDRPVRFESHARVVGVLPPGVNIPVNPGDVWAPFQMDPQTERVVGLQGIGRLKPGVSPAAARADLLHAAARAPQIAGPVNDSLFGLTIDVEPLRTHALGGAGRVIWIAFATTLLVLVIACINVANLLLIRADAGRQETAVRLALGAGRGRLVQQFLIETLILTTVAGCAAIVIGAAGLRTLLHVAPEGIPRLEGVSLRPAAILTVLALATLAGIVLALLQAARVSDALPTLREAARGTTLSQRQHAVRGALVVAQVALSLVVLAGAGVMVRSAAKLRAVPPGLDPTHLLVVKLALPESRTPHISLSRNTRRDQGLVLAGSTLQRVLDETGRIPGVSRTALMHGLPLSDGSTWCHPLSWEGMPPLPPPTSRRRSPCVRLVPTSAGSFAALGMRITGRPPAPSDLVHPPLDIVVSRPLANRLWPGSSPLGKWIKPGFSRLADDMRTAPLYRVVGVAEGLRMEGLDKPLSEVVFLPLAPPQGEPGDFFWRPLKFTTLFVRTQSPAAMGVLPALRDAIAGIDREILVESPQTMTQVVARSVVRTTFVTTILVVAAGMALLLSIVGLYGAIAYAVTQRRQEIGIRMALGARNAQVSRMITWQAGRLALLGVGIGVVAALGTVRMLRSLVYEISPTDPSTLIGVSLLLTAVATLAGYLPARRAARIDPMEAIR